MHLPSLLKMRFSAALEATDYGGDGADLDRYAGMIRPAGNPKFGDYQSNCAMPLGKQAKANPRDVAQAVLDKIDLDDLCDKPEIAGPGFINLRIRDDFLQDSLVKMLDDARCLVAPTETPKKIVIDYSSPNVAKPMHVGHIRTTVIGDCLSKVLRFLGHDVITDNHLGDWGTQFGMIIYGYKHFGDPEVVKQNPVPELAGLYRIVHQLMGYQEAVAGLSGLEEKLSALRDQHAQAAEEANAAEGKEGKKKRKAAESLGKKVGAAEKAIESAKAKIAATESDPEMKDRADKHADIGTATLQETAKLHAGDEENLTLWKEFLPFCKDEINRVYGRLDVTFDHVLGESFYHPMLGDVVNQLQQEGIATESDGAICVFLDGFDAPMIVQKRDGAFLYATTDIATLRYRRDNWAPDEILYVVDTRQGEHFQKLFALAPKIGLGDVKLVHVNFGTVLGTDGKPIKTRSGTLIGLESLLDDAVAAAYQVVCDPTHLANLDPPMEDDEKRQVSETVGIGAIKYADLGHDRTSDYQFNLEKFVALSGNTATYAQYSYARTVSIMKRVGVSEEDVIGRVTKDGVQFTESAERTLALRLLQFEEALQEVYVHYAPNHLVDYVYTTAEAFSKFNEQCHVLNAPSPQVQTTRLALVMLTGRVIRKALELLGINVVNRM